MCKRKKLTRAERLRRELVEDHIKTRREMFEDRARLNRHVFRYGAPPPGSVLYDEHHDMSAANGVFVNGRQKDALTVIRPSGRGYEDIGTGAYNTEKPDFYRVALAGRPYEPVFPTAESKKFFIGCIKRALPLFPIETESYSILANSAYFVFASYDQTRISLQRFVSLVIETYADYYNEAFGHSGTPFRGRPELKKLDKLEEIADQITLVQRQPIVRGHRPDYPFSSIGEGEGGLTSTTAFNDRFGAAGKKALQEASTEEYSKLHAVDLSTRLFGLNPRLTEVIEETLIDYGCFTKRAMPNFLMPKVVAEVNERSGASFKKISRKMGGGWRTRYELLVKTICELIIESKRTFDYAWRTLQVEKYQKRPVAIDVAEELFDRLGYSIDQIFQMMGFAYCAVINGTVQYYNEDLLVRLIKDYALEHNCPVTKVIELFGIRNSHEDPQRVLRVSSYFM